MPPGRMKFQRPLGELLYRKMFVIAAEGGKTEPQYFTIFDVKTIIRVNCLKGKNESSTQQVLKRMEDYLKKIPQRKSDEAWLVVDKDQWSDDQLRLLHTWAQLKDSYGFALSNPKFEYWLLLHFEDGTGVSSSRGCSERLRGHLPDYDKGINAAKITPDRIDEAIRRDKMRDNPPCEDWPRSAGSTVYRLISQILAA